MMAHDASDEDGTGREAETAREADRNSLALDVVTLEAFLAALRADNSPNERHLTLARTSRSQIE
ncbi:hypothetical protein K1T73_17755 [Roseovarius sp. SCSIO 43702]|uniref:hypothetical protein n=1 Tax=Roseovarius sp. SCSIO 43702 TaxID=2823043 RepID=UPI001C72BBE3|nr:hypothetical protein [Roseovarius sp. SCSIO 43702]QYX56848.1 hypothetical protein K1T73_17755 [Roseovarius sp. SCSIO 43702]